MSIYLHTCIVLHVADSLKHSTGLRLERALWIPKHLRQPPSDPPMSKPLTPKESVSDLPPIHHDDSPKHDDLPVDPAWDPASKLPLEDVEPLPSTDRPHPGMHF